MNTARLNITLPKELGAKLMRLPNKSAFIAEALREKISKKDKEKKLFKLKEAYQRATSEESQLTRDWDTTVRD